MTKEAILAQARALADATGGSDVPCKDRAPETCCSREKATAFHFGGLIAPMVYARLCPACRAYWHATMAENCIRMALR